MRIVLAFPEHVKWLRDGAKGQEPAVPYLNRVIKPYRHFMAVSELEKQANRYLEMADYEGNMGGDHQKMYLGDAADCLEIAWLIMSCRMKEAYEKGRMLDTMPRENLPGSFWWLMDYYKLESLDYQDNPTGRKGA